MAAQRELTAAEQVVIRVLTDADGPLRASQVIVGARGFAPRLDDGQLRAAILALYNERRVELDLDGSVTLLPESA